MNKLVYSVFKAIALSIIFVFIFDMAFYLYRAVSLNARMESISTSLKKVVMDNNYLPSEDAKLYANILGQMVADFNGCTYTIGTDGKLTFANDTDPNDNFISGMHWNYGSNASGTSSSQLETITSEVYTVNSSGNWSSTNRKIVEKDMSKPREYGDIQIVQLRVGVYQPLWNWSSGTPTDPKYKYTGQANEINGNTGFNRNATYRGTEFTYTYYVPCMKYKSTNIY